MTGTYPEYSEEDYLNAVTANLILNIGPEPVNTPLHQTWKHKHRVLLQTTLDGAALKLFSVLPMDINSKFTDKTENNSLNSNFINTQETLKGSGNLTQQEIQTPSHFNREKIDETMTTTTQQNISSIHLTLTSPHNKNIPFPQTTI